MDPPQIARCPPDLAETVNILLVDDQPAKLLASEAILTELGQRIYKAKNGLEALELLLRNDFAVILLDVNMPGMDGFETAALIRQRPRFEQTPIIFITGYNTTDFDRMKGYELGAVDYLYLPVIPTVLKAKVTVFVELARQTKLIKSQAAEMAVQNQKQSEQLETIQKLNRELSEAIEELQTFSYSVSHDLRAPLRSLAGYANVLLEDYGPRLDDQGREYLCILDRAAKRMDRLTRDLLSYARIAREEVRLEPMNIGSLLDDIISVQASGFTHPARFVIDPNLSPVVGHRVLLEQCLHNLLNNAAKFVPEGVTPEIRIRTENRPGFVRLWVEDNGIGINPSFHHKIFNIFERVGEMKRYEGTGIGLAIVHRAVQRMGGKCGVDSALGKGSRFWIDLLPVEKSLTLKNT